MLHYNINLSFFFLIQYTDEKFLWQLVLQLAAGDTDCIGSACGLIYHVTIELLVNTWYTGP